jgi:hypothetical protein
MRPGRPKLKTETLLAIAAFKQKLDATEQASRALVKACVELYTDPRVLIVAPTIEIEYLLKTMRNLSRVYALGVGAIEDARQKFKETMSGAR